jgi:hypothetical protein
MFDFSPWRGRAGDRLAGLTLCAALSPTIVPLAAIFRGIAPSLHCLEVLQRSDRQADGCAVASGIADWDPESGRNRTSRSGLQLPLTSGHSAAIGLLERSTLRVFTGLRRSHGSAMTEWTLRIR